MDISRIELEAFRLQSERDTTTPYTLDDIIDKNNDLSINFSREVIK